MYLKLLIILVVKVILCLVSFKVAQTEIDRLEQQILGVTKDLPLDVLDNILKPLTDVQNLTSTYSPQIEKSANIRYFHKSCINISHDSLCFQIHFIQIYLSFNIYNNIKVKNKLCVCVCSRAVGLTLSCLILLVVICNVLGLLLGTAGLNAKDNPTKRSGTSNCGGIFFMA